MFLPSRNHIDMMLLEHLQNSSRRMLHARLSCSQDECIRRISGATKECRTPLDRDFMDCRCNGMLMTPHFVNPFLHEFLLEPTASKSVKPAALRLLHTWKKDSRNGKSSIKLYLSNIDEISDEETNMKILVDENRRILTIIVTIRCKNDCVLETSKNIRIDESIDMKTLKAWMDQNNNNIFVTIEGELIKKERNVRRRMEIPIEKSGDDVDHIESHKSIPSKNEMPNISGKTRDPTNANVFDPFSFLGTAIEALVNEYKKCENEESQKDSSQSQYVKKTSHSKETKMTPNSEENDVKSSAEVSEENKLKDVNHESNVETEGKINTENGEMQSDNSNDNTQQEWKKIKVNIVNK